MPVLIDAPDLRGLSPEQRATLRTAGQEVQECYRVLEKAGLNVVGELLKGQGDFVEMEHYPGDEPLIRLIETKENVKDAARKAQHVPSFYGKVLFLTPDGNRMKWVNDDGSLGAVLDFDDLQSALERLAQTRPTLDSA